MIIVNKQFVELKEEEKEQPVREPFTIQTFIYINNYRFALLDDGRRRCSKCRITIMLFDLLAPLRPCACINGQLRLSRRLEVWAKESRSFVPQIG